MKKHLALFFVASICFLGLAQMAVTHAAGEPSSGVFEYVTIQWAGSPRDLYVVRPDTKIDLLGGRLSRDQAPPGAEERSYFMNLAMNSLGKEGYEFAGLTDNKIVMKRPVHH